MEGMLLPILIAGSVVLVVFALFSVLSNVFDPQKRKLSQRLTNEGRPAERSQAAKSIVNNPMEVAGLSGVMIRVSLFGSLHRKLLHAWPELSLAKFVGFTGLLAFTLMAISGAVTGSLIVSGVAAAIGLYIPFLILTSRKNKRQKMLALQLPEALDFLSRILKAGHSFSTGLQMMGEELPAPLGTEFRRAYDQHSLGFTIDDALKDMATRIDSTDFAFFVTAVLIQRQTGGDLSEVLGNISGMIRQRIRLQQHVKAKTAEGRFTGYILAAFPAVMFVLASVLNPEYAGVLWKTSIGIGLLATAFGLTLIGLFVIKKITTVRV